MPLPPRLALLTGTSLLVIDLGTLALPMLPPSPLSSPSSSSSSSAVILVDPRLPRLDPVELVLVLARRALEVRRSGDERRPEEDEAEVEAPSIKGEPAGRCEVEAVIEVEAVGSRGL